MNVKLEANGLTESIVAEIERLPELTDKATKNSLKDIGKIIVKNVKAVLHKSKNRSALANFDGTTPYVHVVDDIKTAINCDDGWNRIIVKGGKYTGYKWHLLDDGTMTHDGRVKTRATHFTREALEKSEPEIEAYIDKILAEVANGE